MIHFLHGLLVDSMARNTKHYLSNPFGSNFTPSAGAAVRDYGVERTQHIYGIRRKTDMFVFLENIAPCVIEGPLTKDKLFDARKAMIGKHRRRLRK